MVELRVLGGLRVTAPDQPEVQALARQAKRAALLTYLAVAVPRGDHRRDKLLVLFWPDLDSSRARAALSQAVYVLRSSLGDTAVTSRGDGQVGLRSDLVWCDAAAFEAALDSGCPADALALYRGDLLDGFFIAGAPDFEQWLDTERARLRQRASDGAWTLAEEAASDGNAFEAERWAHRAFEFYPADETVARRLMTFLHGLGDRAAAIRAYEDLVGRLAEEYDLEPSAETRELAAAIRDDESRTHAVTGIPRSSTTKSLTPDSVTPPAGHASRRPREEQRVSPTAVTPAPVTPPSVGSASRRRRALVWIALSVTVLTGLTLGAQAWVRGSRVAARPQLMRFPLEFPPDQALASGLGGAWIALSPDGSRLVYVGRDGQGTRLFLRSLDRVDVEPIPQTRGAQQPFFSPDGRWLGFVAGNAIRKVPVEGGPAITVTTITTNVPGVSWGADDAIVFATPAGLWRVPANGGEAAELAISDTANGERYRHPEVLPGGNGAVFTRVGPDGFHLASVSLGTGVVRRLGLEGANPRYLPSGHLVYGRSDGALLAVRFDAGALLVTGGVVPVADNVHVGVGGAVMLGISRAGTFAYVPESIQDRTLAIVDRVGHPEIISVPARGFVNARLSPDGRRVVTAVAARGGGLWDLWAFDLVERGLRRLTTDSGSIVPVWNRDGTRVAYGSKPGGREFGFAIRSRAADGSDSASTLAAGAIAQFPNVFTPDGQALVFEKTDPLTNKDLWILPLGGDRSPYPYVRGSPSERGAAMSPDGRWLAYVSDESGQDEVVVNSFPEPGSPVQISTGGGREPQWAPDGREVFYRNEDGLVAVAIELSSPTRVRQREVLFDDRPYVAYRGVAAYDVFPNGERFLMILRGAEDHDVEVVVNGFAELEESPGFSSR